ncbi:MAG TPA: acetylxylan esterase [Phycisphaerae bacterium]|nr:acetylxylan esterase [Phycisphaerae bacterium]
MPHFDLPLKKLRAYNPPERAPKDFDAFWKNTLAHTASLGPPSPHFIERLPNLFPLVDIYDVTFAGFANHPIKAWFLEPAGNDKPLPCIISFIGYSGGRGLPADHLAPPCAGYAHFVMDTRGQGASSSGHSFGETPDPVGSGPATAGFLTKGIQSPDTYFYRRVFTDAVRAVQSVAQHPHVDPKRLAVSGVSQGGGIALATAALLRNKIKLCMADVPFLCHFRRAATLVDTHPYHEIAHYLRARRMDEDLLFHTLSYFDALHFAPRITARTLMSVALMDNICPPSTVFAAYNRIPAKKEIRIYPFNTHEGGSLLQLEERLAFAAKHL